MDGAAAEIGLAVASDRSVDFYFAWLGERTFQVLVWPWHFGIAGSLVGEIVGQM